MDEKIERYMRSKMTKTYDGSGEGIRSDPCRTCEPSRAGQAQS